MASTTVGEVVYDVKIDQGKLVVQLKDTDGKIQQLGKTAEQSANQADRAFNRFSKGSLIAVSAGIAAIGVALTRNLGAGISRLDTLNNFPRVMQNFGLSAEDGQVAIAALSKELIGLPTSLDAGARAVQRFTSVNNNVKASTALFLSFNNALIAGGASMDIQNTALEQMSQGYAKGRLDIMEWRALLTAMPAQLNQVAEAMGITSTQLGEGLRTGAVSVDDFLLTISKLNKEGVGQFSSFREQAVNQVDGVGVTITNLNTAIVRSIEGMLSSIGNANLKTIIGGIADAFGNLGRGVSAVIEIMKFLGPVGLSAVVGITALTTAMIATRNATTMAGRAMLVFRGILTAITKHPIIFAITGIVAGLTSIGAAMGLLSDSTADATDYAQQLEDSLKNYEPPIRSASGAADDFGKKMAKIAEQAEKINEDYRYSLAQLVQSKNENIAALRETLNAEKKAYDNAYAERLAGFNTTQNKEEKSHAEKTKALQNQINFLTKYNNAANNQQVTQLRFALARENAEYRKSTQLREAEFDAQTKSASEEYEKRRAENQKKLDEELSLLEKHRAEVLSVRGVMLRDEIENLKHSRKEQLIALEQQKTDLRESLAAQRRIIAEHNASLKEDAKKDGQDTGKAQAKGFRDGYAPVFKAISDANKEMVEANKKGDYAGSQKAYQKFLNAPLSLPGRASGGPVNANQPYFVGENPDGSLNKTSELFIPKRSGSIVPSDLLQKAIGGGKQQGNSTTVNVSVNMSGVMASGRSDLRQVATQLGQMINETVLAKTGKTAIQGI